MIGIFFIDFLKVKLKICIEEDLRLDNFYFVFNIEVIIIV